MSKKAKIKASASSKASRDTKEAKTLLNKQKKLWKHWRNNQGDETALNAFVYALNGEHVKRWHNRVFGN